MEVTKVSREYWKNQVSEMQKRIEHLQNMGCGKNGYSPALESAKKQYDLTCSELDYYIKNNL